MALVAMVACDRKEPSSGEAVKSETDKQERLAALLKENGLDPSTLPSANNTSDPAPVIPPTPASSSSAAAPSSALAPLASSNGQSAGAAPVASADTNTPGAEVAPRPSALGAEPRIQVRVVQPGAGPKSALRYHFTPGDTHKFVLDIQVAAERKVDGQPTPGMPPFSLTLRGNTTTLSAEGTLARRQHTFVELIPSVPGAPPELATQIKAQYASLSGLQLVETVSTRGMIEGMELDSRAIHPQVLALMQHLQDGMTNAFLALPEQPVGAGARWVASTTTDAAGIAIVQESEVSLTSLEGQTAEFSIQLKQSAPATKITGANLPPGVSIELVKLQGTGKGSMKVNFKDVLVSSKVDLTTHMETAVSQPDVKGVMKEAATTSVKAQISITK